VCTWCRYCAKTGLRNDFYANFLIEHISRHFLDEVSGPESVGVAGSDITRRAKWVTSVVWVLAHADHLAQIRTKIIHTKIALHLVGDLFERQVRSGQGLILSKSKFQRFSFKFCCLQFYTSSLQIQKLESEFAHVSAVYINTNVNTSRCHKTIKKGKGDNLQFLDATT
jgi:cytochrome c biogenesis factor